MYTFYILLGLAHEFQNDMLVAKLIFHCARSILRNWLGSEHEFGSAAGAAATGSVEWEPSSSYCNAFVCCVVVSGGFLTLMFAWQHFE